MRLHPGFPSGARWIWLAAGFGGLLLTASCLVPAGQPCRTDDQCSSDQACTRNGECAAALISVRLFWTVGGLPASADACLGIDELSIAFEDLGSTSDELIYRPIPCTLGQIYFDRLSARFETVTVAAHGSRGEVLDLISLPLQASETTAEIDLQPE